MDCFVVVCSSSAGTNVYLVGSGDRRILIDAGEGVPAFASMLRECLAAERCAIDTILLTHQHWDHIGGLDQVLDIVRDQGHLPRVFKMPHDEGDVRLPEAFSTVEPLRHGAVFEVPGATLDTIWTPGHTSDSCSFWLREENCLFVGDCVLGRGSTVFSDLNEYEESLRRLAALRPRRLFCGHGPVVGEDDGMMEAGTSKLQEYIAHRQERTLQVWRGLHDIRVEGAAPSEEDIARAVYKDTEVSERVWPAAVRAVRLTLRAVRSYLFQTRFLFSRENTEQHRVCWCCSDYAPRVQLESRGAVRYSPADGWTPVMETVPPAPRNDVDY